MLHTVVRLPARRPFATIAALGVLHIAALFLLDATSPAGRPLVKIGSVDPIANYGVARSLLFDGDLDLTNEYARLHPIPGNPWTRTVSATGRPGSPFPIGVSLLALPFFAVAALCDLATGQVVDGYSRASMIAYFIANILYLCVGLAALFTFLRDLAPAAARERRSVVALAATLAIWPATTLAYYSLSPMSHSLQLMTVCLFLLAWQRARDSLRAKRWLALGAASGLMVITRWQDALLLALPAADALVSIAQARGERRRERLWLWACAALPCAAIFIPQLIEWKVIYGSWLTLPQGAGFMSFPPAHIGEVLFSSCNGYFVVTPVALLGVVGLLHGAPRMPLLAALLGLMGLEVALIGCLSLWHGHIFGPRYLTSCAPFVAAGLAAIGWFAPPIWRRAAVVAWLACAAWTTVFAAQARLDLIPAAERLSTGEMFADKLFLGRALLRRDAAHAARAALDEGRPADALLALDGARAHGPANDLTLRLEIEAYAELGDAARSADALHELVLRQGHKLY